MIAIDLKHLELPPFWQDSDPTSRGAGTFPLVGEAGTESMGAVYFEIEPGNRLARHTDSEDEILILLEGRGRAQVGDEESECTAGSMVFIPAMVPHGIENVGDGPLRVLGIFAGSEVDATFEEVLHPYGTRKLEIRPQPVTV
jgi:quercetin dioxygenase-like cupin family protein